MSAEIAQPIAEGLLAKERLREPISKMDLREALWNSRADASYLYLMTNSCLRRMSGPQYQALLEAQAEQLFATADAITECLRKMGAIDIRPIYHSIFPGASSADSVDSEFGLDQLRIENQILTGTLRTAGALCRHDIVTASLIDVWIDEARRRSRILFDATSDD
jgi:starvation-inducible DNA-binding protein